MRSRNTLFTHKKVCANYYLGLAQILIYFLFTYMMWFLTCLTITLQEQVVEMRQHDEVWTNVTWSLWHISWSLGEIYRWFGNEPTVEKETNPSKKSSLSTGGKPDGETDLFQGPQKVAKTIKISSWQHLVQLQHPAKPAGKYILDIVKTLVVS